MDEHDSELEEPTDKISLTVDGIQIFNMKDRYDLWFTRDEAEVIFKNLTKKYAISKRMKDKEEA